MSDKILSIDELNKAFQEANQDDAPVAIQTPAGNVVNGDPTKQGTVSPKDYELTLYMPILEGTKVPEGAEVVMNGTAYVQKVTAKQKYVTPRVARKIRNYSSIITLPFLKFEEDGTTDFMTLEDTLKMYELFDDNVINACENLVINVLGLSEHLVQYVEDISLISACARIIKENPSFFQVD